MPQVAGVRFKSCGKIYDFEVEELDLRKGEAVIVESELGLNIGYVVRDLSPVENPDRKLKRVIRKATEDDLQQQMENKGLEEEAKENCLERIMARGLPMKLIATEATLDKKRIIFYFTAEKRIDFRELVKDLAARFKTRIEMRQIGVRDSAKIIGSMGICGLELCCKRFLTVFEPISIKMAKKQDLVLNTGKLSGACGRLMCCLGYEYTNQPWKEPLPTEEKAVPPAGKGEGPDMIASLSDTIPPAEEKPQPKHPQSPAEQGPTQQQQKPAETAEKEKKGKRRRWPMRRRKKKRHKKKEQPQ